MKTLSILISDTNDIFRLGLESIFRGIENVNNICTARNETEIIALLTNMTFDFFCLDIDMPQLDSQNLMSDVRIRFPLIKIILFSSYYSKGLVRSLLANGANSFLTKSSSSKDILQVVQELENKAIFLTSESQSFLLVDILNRKKIDIHEDTPSRELLFLISHELTIKEISACLHLSDKTIEYHRKNLLKMIGARNMIGLAIYAFRNNIYFDTVLLNKFQKWINPEVVSI